MYLTRMFVGIFISRKYNQEEILLSTCKKAKEIKQAKKIVKVDYKGFKVYMYKDGEFITDLNLLESLVKRRKELANEFGVLEKWIFTNRQLVILATKKPIDKESFYKALRIDKGWENFGCEITKEITRNLKK